MNNSLHYMLGWIIALAGVAILAVGALAATKGLTGTALIDVAIGIFDLLIAKLNFDLA